MAAPPGIKLALVPNPAPAIDENINKKNEDPDPQYQRGKIKKVFTGADIGIIPSDKIGENIPAPPANTVYITKAENGGKFEYFYSYLDGTDYKWKPFVIDMFSREFVAGTNIESYPKDAGKTPAPGMTRKKVTGAPGGPPPPPPPHAPAGAAAHAPAGAAAHAPAGAPMLCEALTVADLERIFCLQSASTEIAKNTKLADNPFKDKITSFLTNTDDPTTKLKAKLKKNADYFKDKYKDAADARTNKIPAKNFDTVYVCSDIHSDYLALIKLLRDKLLISDDTVLPVQYDYVTDKYEIYFDTDANGYPTDRANNIYNPEFIANIKWNPNKKKTLLVITGDIIDGRRPDVNDPTATDIDTENHDPFGLFELMIHALIHNLRVSAQKEGSEILFTFGNHDIESIFLDAATAPEYRPDSYSENVSNTVKNLFKIPLTLDATGIGYKNRADLLWFFYRSSPYAYLSIEDNGVPIMACVHAGLHKKNNIKDYFIANGKTDFIEAQQNLLDADTIGDFNDDMYYRTIMNFSNTRIYAEKYLGYHEDDKTDATQKEHDTLCTEISGNNPYYQWIVVGHCQTSDPFFLKFLKTLPEATGFNRGQSLYACKENTFNTKLGFVDIAISEAFGKHKTADKTQILRFRRTGTTDNTLGYYDDVMKVERENSDGSEDSIKVDITYHVGTHRGGGTGKQENTPQIISGQQIISPSVSINHRKQHYMKPNKQNQLRHSLKVKYPRQLANRLNKKYTVKQH